MWLKNLSVYNLQLSYFALMGVFTLHATFMEKNIFLVAHQKDIAGTEPDVVWTLSSSMVRLVML